MLVMRSEHVDELNRVSLRMLYHAADRVYFTGGDDRALDILNAAIAEVSAG